MALTTLAMAGQKAMATSTFNYTGHMQTYVVPGGVTSLNITASGASGGAGDGGSGGLGGTTTAILNVTPGQTIYVFVGGQGNNSIDVGGGGTALGFNGGGTLDSAAAISAGGGGGSTDIRIGGTDPFSRVLVAGGGGGGSLLFSGGAGGGLTGVDGTSSIAPANEAAGGTQSAGGAGEIGSITTGNAGAFGIGGGIDALGVGGGGGGGYFGGGAGSSDGGSGAGGSSYANSGVASSPVFTQGDHTGNGVVTITPIVTTHSPVFTHGGSQSLIVCQNAAATPINTQLQIIDYDYGNTETWTVVSPASNGTVAVGPTAYSDGGVLTPTYFSYTPAPGYNGTDAFTVQVSDGTYSAVTTFSVVVNSIAPITGTTSVCQGSYSILSNVNAGGVWSSNIPSVASVTSLGQVTGNEANSTATISYTNPSGCVATTVFTVNANPAGIVGPNSICLGYSAAYTEFTPGGIWSALTSNVAVDGSGNVSTSAAGVGSIMYQLPSTGCFVMHSINVSAPPAAITGPSVVCLGASVYLSDATPGSVSWKSNDTSIAKVTASGVVTGGHSTGTTTITYTITSGCYITTTVTTLPNPPAITGNTPVCAGSSFVLSDPAGAGSWSSANPSVAAAGSDGTITGVAGGSTYIYYTDGNGCKASVLATVNAINPITGSLTTCLGLTTLLADASTGGTWSSASVGVATVSTTGAVNGVTVGTAVISYRLATGCVRTATVNITAGLPPITGSTAVCLGATTGAVTDATTGGTWTSSAPSIANVGIYGAITTSNPGVVTITYSTSTCKTTAALTVNTVPSNIGGATKVCTSSSITLSDFVGGGAWTGTNASGSIDASGVVYGLTPGTMVVTYTMPATGCFKNYTVTINNTPTPIGGVLTVCTGATTFLTDATNPPLSWSSNTTSVATITNSGALTGHLAGNTTITYTLNNGCYATAIATVSTSPAAPAPITGPSTVSHAGPGITLSDVTVGGTWSSSNPSILAVDGTGHVTALLSAGSSYINYIITNAAGCTATVSKLVGANPAPVAHGGTTVTTVGSVISIADQVSGGEWTSSDYGVATVDANGVVTATAAGNVTITHTTTGNDGETTTTLTHVAVNASAIEAALFPNPNKGTFAVKGSLGTTKDAAVTYEISNMLGQVVYTNSNIATGGVIDQQISIGSFASGMYMLNIKSGNETKAIHFVVE